MNDLIRVIGYIVVAIIWVASPIWSPLLSIFAHENVAVAIGLLIVCETAFLIWFLYHEF